MIGGKPRRSSTGLPHSHTPLSLHPSPAPALVIPGLPIHLPYGEPRTDIEKVPCGWPFPTCLCSLPSLSLPHSYHRLLGCEPPPSLHLTIPPYQENSAPHISTLCSSTSTEYYIQRYIHYDRLSFPTKSVGYILSTLPRPLLLVHIIT